jgi:hypothetical protein
MGATPSGGSVVETIRQQLSAGYSGDQVVEGLMAGGLSRPSAERFVQRAGGHVTSAAPPPIPPVAHGFDAPPPLPVAPAMVMPPPVPSAYQAAPESAPFERAQPFQHSQSLQESAPLQQPAAAAPALTASPMNGLKLAGGAALLLVGVALLAISFSASDRVRLKLPLALVLGGGATLVQAIRER